MILDALNEQRFHCEGICFGLGNFLRSKQKELRGGIYNCLWHFLSDGLRSLDWGEHFFVLSGYSRSRHFFLSLSLKNVNLFYLHLF